MNFQAIIAEFIRLEKPDTESGLAYSTIPLTELNGHRLGKSKSGQPAFLIRKTSDSPKNPRRVSELEKIEIHHGINCDVVEKGQRSAYCFSIIEFTGEEEELKSHFLLAGAAIVTSISPLPNSSEIYSSISKFTELFKHKKSISMDLLKEVWGKLFLLFQTPNPRKYLQRWKSNNNFSSTILRQGEVLIKPRKTESSPILTSKQEVNNTNSYFVSFVLKQELSGKNLFDLERAIRDKLLGEYELLEFLFSVISPLVEKDAEKVSNIRFDYEFALKTLEFIPLETVPQKWLENIPPEIINVDFQVHPRSLDSVGIGEIIT